MLILSRLSDEALRIGDEIQVTVLAIYANQKQVTIQVTMPGALKVRHEEVCGRVHVSKQGVTIKYKR